MNASIYAGNLQRTGEYQTRGLRTLHGIRWTFQTQGHIRFPLLVAHDMVYVGSNDGCFYALGTHTGVPQWRFETEGAPLSANNDTLMDEEYYTGVTSVQLTETTAYFGTVNGTIYGLDLETGRQTWQFVREKPEIGEEPESLVIRIDDKREIEIKGPPGIFHMIVVDDLLLFWSESGLSAVDATTKERLWLEKQLSPFTESLTNCPTVADQILYGITNFTYMNSNDIVSGIYAYDLSTHANVWDHGFSFSDDTNAQGGYEEHCARGVIPVANGTAYFLALTPEVVTEEGGDDEGSTCLVAVDARTGTPQWSFVLEQEQGYEGYTALANNLAYVVQIDGNIFAIDLVTHEARWTRQLEGDAFKNEYVSPSLADGILYLPRDDGLLIALDALTGQDLWRVQLNGEITTPCTIADGVVYVAAGASVYALH